MRYPEFYRKMNSLDMSRQNYLCIVIEGEHIGEKALCSDEEIVCCSENEGFFALHKEEVTHLSDGIYEIASEKVSVQFLGRQARLVICGAGHVSMPVIRLGKMLSYHVTCIDDREEFAQNAREAGADRVICEDFKTALQGIEGGGDTYFIIVTRGHRYDHECICSIAEKDHAYIGLMGSRRRTAIVKERLIEDGVGRDLVDSIHTPIGLEIGSETPEEIAVSIMAEIISVRSRNKKQPGFSDEIMSGLLNGSDEMILSSIAARRGSAPRDVGSRMLVKRDGSTIDTIGGGCVEAYVISRSKELLKDKDRSAELLKLSLSDDGEGINEETVCGGELEIFLEKV